MSAGKETGRPAQKPKVLSEDWEVALRAGQEAEGLAGSVEDELAVVHLLRHARAPEGLAEARLDAVWADIDAELAAEAPAPWWRRPWTWIGATAFATAAAAAVLVIVIPNAGQTPPPTVAAGGDGGSEPELASAAGQAAALERQFQILAPGARRRVEREVDDDRTQLREQLLAQARAAGDASKGSKGSMGGAP